jgi:hypothetical protein
VQRELTTRIDELSAREERLRTEIDEPDRAAEAERAFMIEDVQAASLFLRYQTAAQSTFFRAYAALTKALENDRAEPADDLSDDPQPVPFRTNRNRPRNRHQVLASQKLQARRRARFRASRRPRARPIRRSAEPGRAARATNRTKLDDFRHKRPTDDTDERRSNRDSLIYLRKSASSADKFSSICG